MKSKTIRKKDYGIAASAMRYSDETAGLASITREIERFWLRKDITLVPLNPDQSWSIKLGEKIHETACVIRQGNNYHFAFSA